MVLPRAPLAAVAAALALTGAAAPAADATTGSLDTGNGVLTLTAPSTGANLYFSTSGGQLQVSASGTDTIASLPGCANGGGGYYVCPGVTKVAFTGSGVADKILAISAAFPFDVHAGGGNDEIATGDAADVLYGEGGSDTIGAYGGNDLVDGGPGNDGQLRGDAGDDTVYGGDGNDGDVQGNEGSDVVEGGPGNDDVSGDSGSHGFGDQDGDDVIRGNDGNDVLVPQGGTDVMYGGAGVDTASYEGYHGDQPVSASLNGVADDGPDGDGDNVDPAGDVENLTGPDSSVDSTLTGNDGPNVLEGEGGVSDVVVDGRGGDDHITAGNVGSAQTALLIGGEGNDLIEGFDASVAIDGGPGDDTLSGTSREDVLVGGPGRDTFDAGSGNDLVKAIDGEQDTIGCGVGADQAEIDGIDVVNADPGSLCETVRVAVSAGGGGAGGGGAGAGGGGGAKPGTGPAQPGPGVTGPGNYAPLTVGGAATLKVRKNAVALPVSNPNPFAVTVSAQVTSVKAIAAAKKARLTLAAGKVTIKPNGKGTLTIKLSSKGTKALKRLRKIKATVSVTTTGPSGVLATTKRTVTLKA